MANGTGGQRLTFEQMQERVFEFDKVIAGIGVDVLANSPLQKACLDAITLVDLKIDPSKGNPKDDVRPLVRPILGLWSLVNKTLRLYQKPGFEAFRAHFQMLTEGIVWQNERYVVRDQASDKIFELMFGLSVFEVCTTIEVDDPVNSSAGKNPDIIADIQGDRWGFACKVVSGDSAAALIQNLGKAIDQIEVSSATVGIPVINFRDLIPHDSLFWPMLNPFEWQHEGADPKSLEGGPDQEVPPVALHPMVTAALQHLTATVNLKTGIIHSSDHQKAVEIFETLHLAGIPYEPAEIRAGLVGQGGWGPKDADEVTKLAADMAEGKRLRGRTGKAIQGLLDYWAEKIEGANQPPQAQSE